MPGVNDRNARDRNIMIHYTFSTANPCLLCSPYVPIIASFWFLRAFGFICIFFLHLARTKRVDRKKKENKNANEWNQTARTIIHFPSFPLLTSVQIVNYGLVRENEWTSETQWTNARPLTHNHPVRLLLSLPFHCSHLPLELEGKVK